MSEKSVTKSGNHLTVSTVASGLDLFFLSESDGGVGAGVAATGGGSSGAGWGEGAAEEGVDAKNKGSEHKTYDQL